MPGDGKLSPPLSLAVFDAPSGSGVLTTGQLSSSGAPWFITGTGAGTTSINPAGYIEGNSNTYCYLQAPSRVFRVEQDFSGPLGTIAIAGNNDLQSLIHQNFTSGSVSALTIFVGGSSTNARWDKSVAQIPNINDGQPHKLALEVQGAMAFAYVDGVLVGVAADSRLLTAGGSWAYSQIHSAAGDRIYGMRMFVASEAISDDDKPAVDVAQLRSVAVACRTITTGNPSAAGWLPVGTHYFHTDDNQGFNFQSTAETRMWVQATQGANRATFNLASTLANTTLSFRSNANGVADIQYQGGGRVEFPFNVARVDLPVPLRLPTYTVATLPNVATFVQCIVYVSDGTGNKRLAVSDGTNWRFPDGAIVS